jgi:hypothetical protein
MKGFAYDIESKLNKAYKDSDASKKFGVDSVSSLDNASEVSYTK